MLLSTSNCAAGILCTVQPNALHLTFPIIEINKMLKSRKVKFISVINAILKETNFNLDMTWRKLDFICSKRAPVAPIFCQYKKENN